MRREDDKKELLNDICESVRKRHKGNIIVEKDRKYQVCRPDSMRSTACSCQQADGRSGRNRRRSGSEPGQETRTLAEEVNY